MKVTRTMRSVTPSDMVKKPTVTKVQRVYDSTPESACLTGHFWLDVLFPAATLRHDTYFFPFPLPD